MIEKVQYSDFNRFLVSTGYVLITIGLLLPYFYLHENFDLLISIDTLAKYTPVAQNVIGQKQNFSLSLINAIPIISASSILVGIIMLFIGGVRWFKRQKMEDEKLSLELNKLKTENKKAEHDFESSYGAEKVNSETKLRSLETEIELKEPKLIGEKKHAAQTYLLIEALIAEKFRIEFSGKYNVFSNYVINGNEYDIILNKKIKQNRLIDERKDVIVEVKFSVLSITAALILETLTNVAKKIEAYPQPVTTPIVFFVTGNNKPIDEHQLREEITKRWSEKTLNKWNLIFRNIKDMESLNLRELVYL